VDPTLIHYAKSTLNLVLKALLFLAILEIFGIETTSFSAILAAAGVAIGVAWSGLLSNFAAGVFLIILRPFRVGDSIQAAGITGTVREIGMFATTLDNSNNLRVFVSNNKLFSDNITNYSTNPYRIASFRIQLARGVDPNFAIALFSKEFQKIPSIATTPAVSGEVSEFNTLGVIVTLSVPAHQSVYNDIVARGNELIFKILKTEDFPTPENRMVWIKSDENSPN